MQPFENLARLSLNQMTAPNLSLAEAVDGCARAGIPFIGLWRHKVAEVGLQQSLRLVRDAGLRPSSLCRGGLFPAGTPQERRARLDDNERALDEAAELGAGLLVLVCGPAADRNLATARAQVAEGIATLAPHAAARGVRLGIEPLHPMFAAERSVVVTLAQALDLAERFESAHVGVLVDAYHVWWDPALYQQLARAAGRIAGLHVSDWLVPTPDMLQGRGLPGDGVIELRHIRAAVDAAGYSGPIEVEIFNQTLAQLPGNELIEHVCARFLAHV